MHRRMTIRSNPPGALVVIDGKERGYTPYSQDFLYYSTHELQLVKPGFETLTTTISPRKPWYQYFPLEFISDNLWPHRVTDRHQFHFQMEPQRIVPEQDLLNRAQGLRSQSQVGGP